MTERLTIAIPMNQTWDYTSGEAMEKFCRGLLDKKIEAMKCDGCGRRYLPPRPFCGNCCMRMSKWVPVRSEGVLEAWTVVYLPILDGRTGETRPSPYGMGLIRLDGADTMLNHYLSVSDPDQLQIGLRVRAVWRDELLGAMDDILHFEVIQ